MDQKYCVGYSKTAGKTRGIRSASRPNRVKRNGTPGHEKRDAGSSETGRTVFADHMQPSILWVREYLAALVGWQETFKLVGPQVSGIPDAERRHAQSFRHSSAVPSQADHAFLYNAARWVSVASTETRRQRTRSSSRSSGKTFKHSLHLLADPFCATKPSGTCSGCSSLTRTAAVHTHRWKMSWWRPRW